MKDRTCIWVVDDDSDNLFLFERALAETPWEAALTTANSGFELLDKLTTTTNYPDIIFIDLNMPILDGFGCLSRIRAMGTLEQIRLIVFSTSSDEKYVDRAYDLGADYYVCKPPSFEKLKKAISTVLAVDWANHAERPSREHFLLVF